MSALHVSLKNVEDAFSQVLNREHCFIQIRELFLSHRNKDIPVRQSNKIAKIYD